MASTATSRYSTVAVTLHWIIAAAIAFQLSLGWALDGLKGLAQFNAFQLHKSIGLTILLLSLGRLGWRLGHRAPPPPIGQPAWERVAAQAVHIGFYVVMIGLPLTGWAIVSASRVQIPTLLWGVVPWPHLPVLPDLPAGRKAAVEGVFATSHALLAVLTVGLLALHLGAVFKHQLIDRDEVLGHMAVGAKAGRWAEPRLWLAVLGLLAMFIIPKLAFAPRPPPHQAAPVVAAPVVAAPVVAAPAAAPPPAAGPSQAPPAAMATDAQAAKPSVWKVEAGVLKFAADWSGSPVVGRFKTWTANILFDPNALDRSKITVSVDVASVSTGDAQRDSSLPSADWLDAADHPKALFTSRAIRNIGDGRYLAQGTLQLRGVAKPFTLPFSLTIDGASAKASGTAKLDRTAFGVGQGEWAATDQIAGPVAVSFSLSAKRAAP